jgi:hypothetical protein
MHITLSPFISGLFSLSLDRLVTVGEGLETLTAASEPCVPGYRHTAPQCESSCHEHAGEGIAPVTRLRPASFELSNCSAFSTHGACLRPGLVGHRSLLAHRPHVSISWALPQALASWGIPPAGGIWLVTDSVVSESPQRVIPFRVFILRDRRTVLYAGFIVGWTS